MGPVAVGGFVVLNVPKSAARLNIMSGRKFALIVAPLAEIQSVPSCRSSAWVADMSDEVVLILFQQGSQTPWAIPGPCSAGLPGACSMYSGRRWLGACMSLNGRSGASTTKACGP